MAIKDSPTFRRRRVAMELRRLREGAALTLEQASEHLECSPTKLSRMETARTPLHPRDVRDLLDLYGVTDEKVRETLTGLARDSRKKGWWQGYDDVLPAKFSIFLGLETAAFSIEAYRSQLLYGLFQTPDYARALMSVDVLRLSPEEVDRRVELRMARQELLTKEDPLRVWAILDESVLHRVVGSRQVMRAQLQHLLRLAERPNVVIQLLPYEAGPVLITAESFEFLRFPEPTDSPIVYIEHSTGGLYLEREEEVREYRNRVDHLIANGVSVEKSLAMIAAVAAEL
ncbi:helix-turn-helix domain-containing protein [Actinoallomurus purpureus]|uniref:helix-turn-helix domain-containing protein n=1 Tax=Actinoallomurus purpureus TaxID=478114 RepID=UPI002093920D|nr:helix-turn-helix transcriptional regulator [Actinoallomurus purpureus]MCO6003736.1 helix-turn-helix domain-containing protein [Actinoallomurus purpureus]